MPKHVYKRYAGDTVYYWTGGRVRGSWHRVLCKPKYIDGLINELNSLGYVARPGKTTIGPPERPPTDAQFRAIEM